MPTYRVTVFRKQVAEVEVDARDEQEAQSQSDSQIGDGDFETWEDLDAQYEYQVVELEHRCDNCDRAFLDEEIEKNIKHLMQRVDAGGVMPSGECKQCGALVYLIEDEPHVEREPQDAG